ncbi:MAG: radical SAM family heme chaperone HemW [Candidatus Omnitrophota bacterium]
MEPLSIYIHVPFCLKKCFYCNFNSKEIKNQQQIEKYVQALKKDILISSLNLKNLNNYEIKSIYFGGGTPSLVRPDQISEIIKLIKKIFIFDKLEITLEINPATAISGKIILYRKAGINRISLGVQSFNDCFLKRLGRLHNASDTLATVKMIKKEKISNFSIDLIYGIPGQTLKDWQEDLDKVIGLDINHVSFYDLTVEKGTTFYKKRKKFNFLSEDEKAQMYILGRQKLKSAGFLQYEISSFAKKGYASMHNQAYWLNQEYLGLGAGAYSYLNGLRFSRVKDHQKYQDQVQQGKIKFYNQERLKQDALIKETLILNLRQMKGVSLKDIEYRFKIKIPKTIIGKLKELNKYKLLSKTKTGYRLSQKGILVYDAIAGELLD